MTAITEAELRQLAKEKPAAISCFEIIEMEKALGRWYLKVHIKRSREPSILTSARKSARSWSNLNNTLKAIRKYNLPTAQIVVTPNWEEGEDISSG